ncbi:MAG TPA: aminotransferase class I/II-fold pyridoxal phosphate-dependent enzyme, partial [Blastocatellia bacterium]|nr:aminotransferase class I/II-fold pyridoxal phosphate-dependent enzyme [Blastocatellia bacterium]
MGFATKAIHAGQEPDPTTGAVAVPIYQTSTYVQDALGQHKGFEYARTQNPTRLALEKNLAALEGGHAAHCFASGMAAIDTVLKLLKAGDHVIVSENTYGGTYRLFERVMRGFGLDFSYVDTTDAVNVENALRENTRMVFLETPTNPIMAVADLEGIGKLAAANGIRLVVDNTFMSPYFLRPLEWGADIIVHSTTKYLNGHSDSIGGVAVTARTEDAERIGFLQNAVGAILSPFDSFLITRGIKTLSVRMRQHDENGRKVAAFLDEHPKVQKVYYPGLPQHPQHERAQKLM